MSARMGAADGAAAARQGPGNGARMWDVLAWLELELPDGPVRDEVAKVLDEPARNCDRFDDDDDAFAAWYGSLKDGDVVRVRDAFQWLYAKAPTTAHNGRGGAEASQHPRQEEEGRRGQTRGQSEGEGR